ncbi:hypothetical protein [Streptomyces sp. NPDC023588]|uniref:hypothetical protein n=1 Tax=Streptomyces sp. NPDC023588 TaxID=3154907 RepID=UPI0033CBABB9
MNNTKRALTAVALAGAMFAVAGPAHAETSDIDAGIVKIDPDSLLGSRTAEGHGAIESDVSYNALTQVLSFDVLIPTLKATGLPLVSQ